MDTSVGYSITCDQIEVSPLLYLCPNVILRAKKMFLPAFLRISIVFYHKLKWVLGLEWWHLATCLNKEDQIWMVDDTEKFNVQISGFHYKRWPHMCGEVCVNWDWLASWVGYIVSCSGFNGSGLAIYGQSDVDVSFVFSFVLDKFHSTTLMVTLLAIYEFYIRMLLKRRNQIKIFVAFWSFHHLFSYSSRLLGRWYFKSYSIFKVDV